MTPLLAQDAGDERERVTAERFLEVLKRRPRPGTALDRVYGFHVRNGSLDELVAQLSETSEESESGPSKMILGLIQLQRGRGSDAVAALKDAEELLPNDAAVSYYLGKALLSIGETEQAATAMERAIQRKPARNEALPMFTELGRIYGRAGLNDKALGVWTGLEELFPGDTRVGGQIARTLAEEGNLKEALKRYESLAQSARQQEQKIAFAVQAAEIKRQAGNVDQATTDLESILTKLRPGSWLYTDVRSRIERGFLKSGDYDALANYYQKKLEDQKDDLELMTRLGGVLVSAGRLDEAAEVLKAAIVRAPEDPSVRLALVEVLLRQSNSSGAAEQFEQLAKKDPGNPDYLLRWGQVLLEDPDVKLDERRTAAADVWKQLAEQRADDAVSIAQVADRLRSIDRSDDALALYRQAIEIDPASPQYREYLGEYLHQLDRKDEAIEVWKAIASGDRRNVDSLIRLAEIYNTFKMSAQSLQSWEQAADNDLNFNQELRYANQLRGAKQYEIALQRLDRASEMAETPDEREQLLRERIATFSDEGTLTERIEALSSENSRSVADNRRLALMHQAAGQLTNAAVSIQEALNAEPENIAALTVAADIYERQNLFADAVEKYEQLGRIDQRFQTSYLEKVAQLQIRLGLANDALKTCEALIDANPASTDSYQFAARTAFRMNRSDEGTEFLRRAMNVARRDNGPRLLLASHFAEQYRTDEAIDLYWQAIDLTTKSEERISVIARLAPLYERKGDFPQLVERVEALGVKENDVRATQLMLASANEAVQDFGAARQAVDQLLARQPRDVGLLENMVRLCDAADELELAIEYQKRVAELASTPDNRFRLMRLQLDAGTIDVAEALSRQVSMSSDPSRISSMIRGAAGRGDLDSAIALAQEVVRKDDSLWDIKITLAQLLLHQSEDVDAEAETNNKGPTDEIADREFIPPHQKAVELCEALLQTNTAWDTRPATAKKSRNTGSQNRRTTSVSPQNWTRAGYEIARAYRLGQYGRNYYGSQRGVTTLTPTCFGHAQVIAKVLIAVAKAKNSDSDQFEQWLKDYRKNHNTLPDDLATVTDAHKIWVRESVKTMLGYLQTESVSVAFDPGASSEAKRRQEDIQWRLFELDPEPGFAGVSRLMNARFQQVRQIAGQNDDPDAADPEDKESNELPARLSDERMDLILSYYQQQKKKAESDPKKSAASLWQLTSLIRNELTLAEKTELLSDYQISDLPDDARFPELVASISFYLAMEEPAKADALVARLLPAVRRDQKDGQSTKGLVSSPITGSIVSMFGGQPNDFVKRHWKDLLDVALAIQIRDKSRAQRSRRSSIGTGTVRVYHQRGPNRGYQSTEVKSSLAVELLSASLAQEIISLSVVTYESDEPSKPGFVDRAIIDHLDQIPKGATVEEQKARRLLAAFAHWWGQRPEVCYDRLEQLAQDYADDVNIRIEHARLASELGDDRKALDILNSFEPLDSEMLVRKEMAAMNLAVRVGDQDRAGRAAERLFGMRMSTATQLALARQLRTLGINDKANAILQRMRGGRRQDESTMLQVAQAFVQAEDNEAAAEVAYGLLRRTNRQSQQGNNDYYRSQAVSILKSAGRLDPLIAMAKRRVDSAPKSQSARSELASLYTAAGKKAEADAVWADIEKTGAVQPQQMLVQAAQLAQADKPKEALKLYFKAFRKDPNLLGNQFYQMRNVVQQHDLWDEMYGELAMMKIEAIPEYRVDELLGRYGGGSNTLTDNKRNFIKRLLKKASLGRIAKDVLESIPKDQRSSFPELRNMVLREGTSDASFDSNRESIWSVNSYSSGGTANGVLKPLVEMLETDEELKAEFAKKLQARRKDRKTFVQSQILLSLLGVSSDDEKVRQKALVGLRKAITDLRDSESGDVACHGDLLWQAGQVLEEKLDRKKHADTFVAFYEAAQAKSGRNNPGNSPQFTIVPRLVNAYVNAGRPKDARQQLLLAYRNADFSEQNQYNPGYGDSQDLQTWKWVADQLVKCDFPIDASGIYGRAIASPGKFERATQWNRGIKVEQFQTELKKAKGKITSKNATLWLETVVMAELAKASSTQADKSHDKRQNDSPHLQLMSLPVTAFANQSAMPTMLMAVKKASASEDGNRVLQDILLQLDKQSQQPETDWSLSAAAIVVASVIQSETVTERAVALSEKLTDVVSQTDLTKAANKGEAVRILTSFVALDAIRVGEIKVDDSILQAMMTSLVTTADALKDEEAKLLLQSRFGDVRKSTQALLANVEAETDQKAPAPQLVDTLLRVAENAADDGRPQQAAKALRLAVRWGPTMQTLTSSSTGDAFVIQQANQSSNSFVDDPREGELTAAVIRVAGRIQESLMKDDDADRATKEAVLATLRDVLLPSRKQTLVTPYEKQIVTRSNHAYFFRAAELKPVSAASILAEVSAHTGQTDSLLAALESRSAPPEVMATIKLHLARAANDAKAFDIALQEFETVADKWLPAADKPAAGQPQGSISITPAVQQRSAEIAERVNTVLHATWQFNPQTYGSAQGVKERRQKILLRVVALINSDTWTAQRLSGIVSLLQAEQLQHAAATSDRSLLGTLLQSLNNAVARDYSGRSEQVSRAKVQQMEQFFDQLKKSAGLANADTVVRPMLQSLSEYQSDPKDQATTYLLRTLSTLSPAEQYAVLKRTVMGQKPDDDIVTGFGIVRYSDVPDVVVEQAAESEWNANIVACDIVPLTDFGLAFAKQCVAAGEAETVTAELRRRSKKTLDQADLLSALVQLTAAGDRGFQATEKTLLAIQEHLRETKPTTDDSKRRFPGLTSIVVLQACNAGMPSELADDLTELLKVHATRSQKNAIVSVLGIARAKMGFGRAANGTEQSPLKHMTSMMVPWPTDAPAASQHARHSMNSEGWVSSTGGQNLTLLMLKFPIVGDFEVAAEIKDGAWGEADLSYGGTLYQAQGWNKKAKINLLRGSSEFEAEVKNIKAGEVNVEALAIGESTVQALCNSDVYYTDTRATDYPWLGVSQHSYRTTLWRDLKITGNPVIPRKVNLLSEHMRGWSASYYHKTLPDPAFKPVSGGVPFLPVPSDYGRWDYDEGELNYSADSANGSSNDPGSMLVYQRPLFSGETLSMEFYWEADQCEVHPTVGPLIFKLKNGGIKLGLHWQQSVHDLTHKGRVRGEESLKQYKKLSTTVVPKQAAWNTLQLTRDGDQMTARLNGKELLTWTVTDQTSRPGFTRLTGPQGRVRNMVLTGDWPESVPENLMAPVQEIDKRK